MPGGVRVGLEERRPVHRARAERGVLERRGVAAERSETLCDELGMAARIAQVLLVQLGEHAVAQPGRPLEQLDRLLLDRMRVGEVLAHPLAWARAVTRLERRGVRPVEAVLEPMHHLPLVARDLTREAGDVRLARTIRDACKQLVRSELESLVGERVRDELAGRVRLQAREQDEPPGPEADHGVLSPRRPRTALVEQLLDHALVPFRLREVLAKGRRDLRIAGDVRGRPELRQRLDLDGMGIGEVSVELLLDPIGHHLGV